MLQPRSTARGLAGALCVLGLVACGSNGQVKNLGGTLSGLNAGGSVGVKNNNTGDTLNLNQNGPFQFPTYVAANASYTVVIVSQPVGQTCTIANGVGMMNSSADTVSNIQITCV